MAIQAQDFRPGDPMETSANLMGQKGDNVRLVMSDRFGPSWHRMEKLHKLNPGEHWTAVQALQEADLDFEVKTVASPPVPDPFNPGKYIEAPKTIFIVRSPLRDDPRTVVFGHATEGWTPIQNRTIAELLDKTGLTRDYPVETMGALGDGETLFASLFAGSSDVVGEEYAKFIGITDGKAANRSLTLFIGGQRMYCQNTVRLATSGAEWTISLRHDAEVETNLHLAMQAIGDVKARFSAYDEAMEVLAGKKIASKTRAQILAFAYPDPRPPAKVRISQQLASRLNGYENMTEANREALLAAESKYEAWKRTIAGHREVADARINVFEQEFPKFGGTTYAVLQGIAEVESWRKSNKGGPKGDDQIATGLLFGDRALTLLRAAVACQRVAGVAVDSRYRKLEASAPSVRN